MFSRNSFPVWFQLGVGPQERFGEEVSQQPFCNSWVASLLDYLLTWRNSYISCSTLALHQSSLFTPDSWARVFNSVAKDYLQNTGITNVRDQKYWPGLHSVLTAHSHACELQNFIALSLYIILPCLLLFKPQERQVPYREF